MVRYVDLTPSLGSVIAALAKQGVAAQTKPSGTIVTQNEDGTKTILGPAAGAAGVAQWVGDTTPPPIPAGMSFSTSNGQILAAWDGTLHGDIPEDMGGIEVLAQGQPVGRLTAAGSLLVAGFPAGTAVAMSARSYDRARAQDGTPAPNFSEPSTAVQVTVAEIVDGSAAIVETVTEYATTTDPATAPTAGWSQTAPAWVAGQYIWVRTTITHGDGSTSMTDPVVVTGNPGAAGATGATGAQGATGPAGATGVGVSSVTRWFYMGTSKPSVPATAPASPWTTTEPGYVAGSTLYYVDIVTYSDGTKSVTPVQTMSSYLYAATAYQTAAGMVKAYTAQPAPPYKVGDIWKNGAALYVCTTGRSSGSYTASDWTRAGDVTASNINGVTITGSVVQSSATNPRSWQDSTGFHQTDSSGNRVFDTTAGQTPLLVGGFKTALTGNRVEITETTVDSSTEGNIQFFTGQSGEMPGSVRASQSTSMATEAGKTAIYDEAQAIIEPGQRVAFLNAANVDQGAHFGLFNRSRTWNGSTTVESVANLDAYWFYDTTSVTIHNDGVPEFRIRLLDHLTDPDFTNSPLGRLLARSTGIPVVAHVTGDTAENNGDYTLVGTTWVRTHGGCTLTLTANQSTPGDSNMNYQSVLSNTGGFGTVTGTGAGITIPVEDDYRIHIHGFMQNSGQCASYLQNVLLPGSTAEDGSYWWTPMGGRVGQYLVLHVTVYRHLLAGQTVRHVVRSFNTTDGVMAQTNTLTIEH